MVVCGCRGQRQFLFSKIRPYKRFNMLRDLDMKPVMYVCLYNLQFAGAVLMKIREKWLVLGNSSFCIEYTTDNLFFSIWCSLSHSRCFFSIRLQRRKPIYQQRLQSTRNYQRKGARVNHVYFSDKKYIVQQRLRQKETNHPANTKYCTILSTN